MTRQRATEFHGLILYRRDYGERDLLIKFLTAEFGKKMFLIRGAKKRGFKLASDLMPFTHGTYVGDLNDTGLSFMTTARETAQYRQIAADITKNAYATYLMSLVDTAFEDGVAIPEWYQRTEQALALIDSGLNPEIIANVIEVQLLPIFGVAPEWRGCVVCGRQDLPFDYSESYGGLLCQTHWPLDPHRLQVNQRTIYYLRQFSTLDLGKLKTITVKATTVAALRQVLDEIYAHQVGVHPKSKRFIDQMQSWAHRQSSSGDTR